VYNWGYSNADIAAANATFNIMRLPINEATANDPGALQTMKGYVDQFADQRAIICMFGTVKPNGSNSHGDGLPDGLAAMGAAWAKVNAVFATYPNVHYEILNEPFGYTPQNSAGAAHYVSDMKEIISYGGLPSSKVILDGMGYADDVQLVAAAGWTGDLGYHFYPNWSSTRTQSAYSNLAQAAIGSLGPRTWITEFGANLGYENSCYNVYDDGSNPQSGDVNALRGLDDALFALRSEGKGVKGAFFWHGWNNEDSYDYWASFNSQGACKVREILQIAGPVIGLSGKCLDVLKDVSTPGEPIDLYECNDGPNQMWAYQNGNLESLGNCMTVAPDGTHVQLWPCNHSAQQQWASRSDGTLFNANSNKCLNVPGFDASNGTELIIWPCTTSGNMSNEVWKVGSAE
jgi:hypothetical protein